MDRIKAHRSAPTVYDPPTFDQMADRIEQLEAKLIIAVAYIRSHIPDSIYEQRQQARAALAELEGGEEAADTAWRGRE
jgi:hypothetical protein